MAYSKLPHIRVHLFGYIFSPSWLPSLVTFILLPVLISLGIWQLQRAEVKRKIEQSYESATHPIDIKELQSGQNMKYHLIKATGYFDNTHLILLDNQVNKQRAGYHIFSPFIVNGGNKVLLVDRGFIAITHRDHLPKITLATGIRTIIGMSYVPGKIFELKKESFIEHWPLRVQNIELKKLESVLHQQVYPFYLRLKSGDDSNLIREWQAVSFPSYRHTGYAIQWFLMAMVLIIIYISLNLSRANK